MNERINPGDTVRHCKGNLYQVLYFAREGLEVPKPDGSGFGGLEGEWYGLWRISGAQEVSPLRRRPEAFRSPLNSSAHNPGRMCLRMIKKG